MVPDVKNPTGIFLWLLYLLLSIPRHVEHRHSYFVTCMYQFF